MRIVKEMEWMIVMGDWKRMEKIIEQKSDLGNRKKRRRNE